MLSSSFVAILIFLTSYAHLVCSFHTPLSHPSVAFQQLIPLLTRRTTSSGSLPFDKVQDHHRSRNLQLNEIPPQRNDDGVIVSSNGDEYSKSLQRSLVWIFAAMSFATVIGATKGYTSAVEFSSGYLLELSLSIDNLFVFLVLFEYFKVPKNSQGKVLNYGIIGAVVLRGLFILAGSIAIGSFHQVLLLFAGILGYSSYKILFNKDDEDVRIPTPACNQYV